MSSRFSNTIALMLISLVLTSRLPSAEAKPVTASKPALNLLKINQYYVLYTCPITPRLDKSGTFIVGAEAIALMLNAKFAYNSQGIVVSLTKAGHTVRFSAGAKTALVDGKPVALPVASRFNALTRQMLIPLFPLVKAFRIRSAWSQTRNTLTLTGKTLMKFEPPENFNISWENPSPDTQSLIPVALTPISPLSSSKGFDLELTVKNVSRRTLPKYSNWVNLLEADKYPATTIKGGIGYSISGAPFPSVDFEEPSPRLGPGATRKDSIGIWFGRFPGYTPPRYSYFSNNIYESSPPSIDYTLYVAAWLVVSRRR